MVRSVSIHCLWLNGLIILSTVVPSLSTERLKLVVGGDHQNPPFEFLEQGVPTGFNVEVMRAVAEVLGAEVAFRLGPWAKIRKALELGEIDALAGMYYSEERSRRVDFSLPHTMVTMGLYVRSDSPIQSIEDIRGKEVIVQRGDIIDDYLREKKITPRIVQVTDPADELRLLATGRHDCTLMPSSLQSEYLIRVLGLSDIKAVGTNLPQLCYCFAVPKGSSALRFRLDEALNILKVNGEYKKIYNKWFGIYEKRDLWQTTRYFVWAMALFMVLLGASFIWSWSLRRQVRIRTSELREREKRLRFTQYSIDKTIDQAYWMTEDGRIFYVNDAACRALGYSSEELTAMSIPDIDPNHPAEVFAEHWRKLRESGSVTMESLHRAKDGHLYPVEIRANHVVFDGREYNCAFATDITQRKRTEEALQRSRDDLERSVEKRTTELAETVSALKKEIAERKRAEKAVRHVNRTLMTLIKCNEVLARTDNEVGLMADICRVITENSRYRHAWVGLAENGEKTAIRPVAGAGCPESGADDPATTSRNQGSADTAVREGKTCLFKDIPNAPRSGPWREEATGQGYCSILSIPLFDTERTMGVLTIKASGADAFDEEEVMLLEQLARDLSFGIASLRAAATRRRMEEALLLSHRCINQAAIGIFQISLEEGRILQANEFASRCHGYTTAELCAMTVFDLDPTLTVERFQKIGRMVNSSDALTFETDHRRKDGTIFPVEITASNLKSHGILTSVTFVKDISERRQAEEQLRRHKELLEVMNRTLEERVRQEVAKNREKDVMLIQQNRQAALGEILDHIAHQWKHPLATISLTAYLLKTETTFSRDSVGEATDSIIDQVKNLTQMLNDYRNFYRPDKEKSVFRVKAGIDKALSFIMPVMSIESIGLEVNTDVGLNALGYPKEFAQVILNLVNNARDAFKEHKVKKPNIVIKGFAENKMAVVTVTDNAGGISKKARGSIFEMNFTTKTQSGGTGIGLYMSRNIIERDMGGDLAASNVGGGAQFCIRLPLAESTGKPAA